MVGLGAGLILFLVIDAMFDPQKGNILRFVNRAFAAVSIITIVAILVYATGAHNLAFGYWELFTDPTQSSTMQNRYLLWETAYSMFVNEGHPVRGLGVGAFWSLAYEYGYYVGDLTEAIEYMEAGVNPHNLYIDTILHYGLVGFVLFLWLIIGNLNRLRIGYLTTKNARYRYLYLGLFCGLLAFYFSALFDFTVFIISRYWAFIGFAVAVLSVGRRWEENDNGKTSAMQSL